jgi:hypothetical protein
MGTNEVRRNGEDQKEAIRPEFNRSIMMDFQGAKITSDVGFLFLRELDVRFSILGPIGNHLEDSRSPLHTKHSLLQMARQRVYEIAAGYEDCNDADFLRIDPALRVAIRKDHEAGASQPMLSKLENEILGNDAGPTVLEAALNRSKEPLTWPKRGNSDRRTIFGNSATGIRGSRPIRKLVNGPKQRVFVRLRNSSG